MEQVHNLMSLIRILPILLMGLSSALGLPQEPKNFSTMSVTEAEQLIEHSRSGPQIRGFIRGVLESERLDLAKIAWLRLPDWTRDDVAAMPDSRFKEDVLLMMLQTGYWPDTITYGSKGIVSNTKPFTPLIEKYLPEVTPTVELINTRQARLRLVAQIEHTRGAQAAAKRDQETQPEELPPSSTSSPTPNPIVAATTSASPAIAFGGKGEKGNGLWLWISAAIAALIAAVVLAIKRLRKLPTRYQ
jgi:hypothetical protein